MSNTDLVPLDTAIHSDLVARFSGGAHPGWLTGQRARELRWGLVLVTVATTTSVGLRAVSDPSPWLHLRVGQYLLEGGRFGVEEWQPTSVRDPYAILALAMPAVVLLGWIRSRALPPWWRVLGTPTAAVVSENATLADAPQQQLRWRVSRRDHGHTVLESV